MVELISRHYQWVFSGIGVVVICAILAALRHVFQRASENHPHLAVHTQNIALHARDFHESYDHALGIFIANTGDSGIHIQRALFRNRVPFLWVFRRTSRLPVYLRAFKDAKQDAHELKFGEQWRDPQTDIRPRERVMTYLPLSETVPDQDTNARKHGEVILRYSSGDRGGTHRVYV